MTILTQTMRLRLGLTAAALVLSAVASASGYSIDGVWNSDAYSTGAIEDLHENQQTVDAASMARTTSSTATGIGQGKSTGMFDTSMDTIHALCTADASFTGAPDPFSVNSASASARITVTCHDKLTITSSTLAYGTPVTLQETLTLHALLSAQYAQTSSTSVEVASDGIDLYGLIGIGDGPSQKVVDLQQTQTITTYVGAVRDVETQFYADAVATSGPDLQFGNATCDASNTSHLYFSVVTPGASFLSASGAGYAPVPEPASIAALGLGLAAFLRRKRR